MRASTTPACSTASKTRPSTSRRAEVEFGMLVPGGEPIVERALASLESADDEVAPVIDWELAGRRVAEADLNALNRPAWLKHAIARRQTRDGAAD